MSYLPFDCYVLLFVALVDLSGNLLCYLALGKKGHVLVGISEKILVCVSYLLVVMFFFLLR